MFRRSSSHSKGTLEYCLDAALVQEAIMHDFFKFFVALTFPPRSIGNAMQASKRVKGRGSRRYRPDEGPPVDVAMGREHSGMNGGSGSRDMEDPRSRHRHHRHRHQRESDTAEADHRSYADDRQVHTGIACPVHCTW